MIPFTNDHDGMITHEDDVFAMRNIDALQLGDKVIAYDRDGDLVEATVISLFRHFMKPTIRIQGSHGMHLICTKEHPFKVPGGPDEFMKAEELQVGDSLLDDLGNIVRVTEVEDAGQANVFNIEVGTWNTYIANGVRVHNIDKG